MQPVVYVVVVAFAVAAAALWAVALVDVAQRPSHEFPPLASGADPKVFWTFIVLIGNAVGSVAYYYTVMKPHPRRH